MTVLWLCIKSLSVQRHWVLRKLWWFHNIWLWKKRFRDSDTNFVRIAGLFGTMKSALYIYTLTVVIIISQYTKGALSHMRISLVCFNMFVWNSQENVLCCSVLKVFELFLRVTHSSRVLCLDCKSGVSYKSQLFFCWKPGTLASSPCFGYVVVYFALIDINS